MTLITFVVIATTAVSPKQQNIRAKLTEHRTSSRKRPMTNAKPQMHLRPSIYQLTKLNFYKSSMSSYWGNTSSVTDLESNQDEAGKRLFLPVLDTDTQENVERTVAQAKMVMS